MTLTEEAPVQHVVTSKNAAPMLKRLGSLMMLFRVSSIIINSSDDNPTDFEQDDDIYFYDSDHDSIESNEAIAALAAPLLKYFGIPALEKADTKEYSTGTIGFALNDKSKLECRIEYSKETSNSAEYESTLEQMVKQGDISEEKRTILTAFLKNNLINKAVIGYSGGGDSGGFDKADYYNKQDRDIAIVNDHKFIDNLENFTYNQMGISFNGNTSTSGEINILFNEQADDFTVSITKYESDSECEVESVELPKYRI
jgi:hypothetical protein